MIPKGIKSGIEKVYPFFFQERTMRFFGDTLKNFAVRKTTIKAKGCGTIEVYELYRIEPVKMNCCGSFYFHQQTFQRLFPEHMTMEECLAVTELR